MKIGIDIRLIGKKRTGDEVVIFNLVKNFALIDQENEYVLLTDNNDRDALIEIGKQLEIGNKANFKIISLPSGNRFSWNFWTLPSYLKKNPVDVYHTQYITPWFVSKEINPHTKNDRNYWFWGNQIIKYFENKFIQWHDKNFGVGVKIVTIVHDISFNFFSQFIKKSDLFFLKTLIPLSLQRADKIVGVSQFTSDEIIKYYKIDPAKVAWIYNSVNEDFATKNFSSQELEDVRQKYKLPNRFVLYMGTLQPRKNIPHLIEAFARIKNELGDTKLVICGNLKAHNYDRRIDQVIEKFPLAGEVVFPGFIDEQDKAAVFQLAHVFAFPSLYEGFGIPLLEAMCRQVPVIASDIPSLREIADKSALFFNVNSLDDFSQKLYSICSDNSLRAKLIQSGKERISFFSWEKSAKKLLAIYQGLKHNK